VKDIELEEAINEVSEAFDEIFELIDEEIGSKAGMAAAEFAKAVIETALGEHEKKGDIWLSTLSPEGTAQLVAHKGLRLSNFLERLRDKKVRLGNVIAEIEEESNDIGVYLGMILWKLKGYDKE